MAKRTMKITYVDDSREVCSPTDQRQITIAGPVIAPITRPKRMERIQTNPVIYGKLATVKCAIIMPGHYVMTANGLKLVKEVEG